MLSSPDKPVLINAWVALDLAIDSPQLMRRTLYTLGNFQAIWKIFWMSEKGLTALSVRCFYSNSSSDLGAQVVMPFSVACILATATSGSCSKKSCQSSTSA